MIPAQLSLDMWASSVLSEWCFCRKTIIENEWQRHQMLTSGLLTCKYTHMHIYLHVCAHIWHILHHTHTHTLPASKIYYSQYPTASAPLSHAFPHHNLVRCRYFAFPRNVQSSLLTYHCPKTMFSFCGVEPTGNHLWQGPVPPAMELTSTAQNSWNQQHTCYLHSAVLQNLCCFLLP